MTGSVIALPGYTVPLAQGEPNKDVIIQLEKLLEKAKSGHLQAIAFCTFTSCKETTCGWVPGEYKHQIASAILTMSHEYTKALVDEGTQ